ncbi:polyprenyl synthetase family protein [Nocardia sp. NPDC057030]|uniref:polyprenyl synthetase family protein n=1 Tax=unclassified Nocardia TaxID=2637762 RepID=UPI00363A434F
MTTGIDTVNHPAARILLAQTRAVCAPVLHESVESLPEPMRRMAGYHFGWWDAVGAPVNADRGKSLRPALTVGTAIAYGSTPAEAAPVAAAIELAHNSTLIHDDVIDGDQTRRGRTTVWRVWGTADAIQLGDALHALAIRVLTRRPTRWTSEAVDRLETALIEVCRGQSEDCAFETRAQIAVDEYVRMAMGKTGALTGCACALGALSAGASPTAVAALDRFGHQVGLGFQFVDDLLGIWGEEATTGKPAGNDLARRKQSLPVVAALASDTAAAVELAGLYRSKLPMTAADVHRAATLIEAAGARESTARHAEQHLAAAIAALPGTPRWDDLIALGHTMIRRNR